MDYELRRSGRKTLSVTVLKDGSVLVRAPFFTPKAEADRFVRKNEEWIIKQREKAFASARAVKDPLSPEEIEALKRRAREYIPPRAAYYAGLLGAEYSKITIRCQKTRWGSCSANGTLSFNCLLMLAPGEVADSVIVHELCHLKEMNHSARFYAEIARVMPDYKERNAWLKKNGRALLLRAGKI